MSRHFYDLFQPTERINPDSKCEIESLKQHVFVLQTENEKLKDALSKRKDVPEETSGDFLIRIGVDGEKWAREFCKRFVDHRINEELMVGWFANAIEAGKAHGARRGRLPHQSELDAWATIP